MPLVLNLHHEIDQQRRLRRRDPTKYAIGAIAVIVLAFALNYLHELSLAHSVGGELERDQQEYKALQPKADKAKAREEELNTQIKVSDSLVKIVEDRFYWAPVLGMIASTVPREVQLTRLSGNISTEPPKRCSISIEGVAASAEPRKTAEELRRALADKFSHSYKEVSAVFKSLEDSPEIIKLDGRSFHSATFMFSIQFRTEDLPPATPVPTKKAHKAG